jgi:hypothetical protein
MERVASDKPRLFCFFELRTGTEVSGMRFVLSPVAGILLLATSQLGIAAEISEPAVPTIIRTIELSKLVFTDAARVDRCVFGQASRILVTTSKGEIWDIGLEQLDGRKLFQSDRPTNFYNVANEPSAGRALFFRFQW